MGGGELLRSSGSGAEQKYWFCGSLQKDRASPEERLVGILPCGAARNELSGEAWPLVMECQKVKPTVKLNNFVLAHFTKVRQQEDRYHAHSLQATSER